MTGFFDLAFLIMLFCLLFVERLIRVITQKGTKAADPKVRDGLVRATLNSQKEMPRRRTKADFNALC